MITRDVYLLTGSNLGNRRDNLERAVTEIASLIGTVTASSHIYESEPWGFTSENLFYNQALCVRTYLSPRDILNRVLEIEKKAGRERESNNYQDRILDVDILLAGNAIIKDKVLTIPHPLLHLRRFALIPLEEIAPDVIHPKLRKSIRNLLLDCQDMSKSRITFRLS